MPHPLADAFRGTMRRWASGVTVVTAQDGARRAGMTVSAFFSVTMEPPTVVVSLHEGAETLAHLRRSGAFAVSILGEGMDAVSGRFAGYGLAPGADRFEGVRTEAHVSGAPVLADAVAWVDCRVSALHVVGTHVLVLGEVLATGARDGAPPPLVYADRGYRRIVPG